MSTAKLEDSTQRPLYGERIIEESKIICFDNPNKKRIYEILFSYLNLHVSSTYLYIKNLQS